MTFGASRTLGRFEALAASYGADLERWPAEERDWARSLLDTSAEAQRCLADAAEVDALMGSLRVEEDARLWPEGGQEAALARLRSGVAGRIAELDRRRSFWRPGGAISLGSGGAATLIAPVGTLTTFGLAAAAGLWVGWMQGAAAMPQPAGLLTFLLSGPFQGFGW